MECYLDKCFNCGKVRHFTKNCRSKNEREEITNFLKEDVEEKEVMLLMMER